MDSGWIASICEEAGEVSICSTIYSAYTGETVQRRVKTQDTWKTKTFPCPAPVTAYNEHMEGVDRSNKLLQYYTAQYKRMKWYRKIFLHFLDIDATNASMHKELWYMTHKQFMEQLIEDLSDVLRVPGAEVTSDSRKTAFGRRICVL